MHTILSFMHRFLSPLFWSAKRFDTLLQSVRQTPYTFALCFGSLGGLSFEPFHLTILFPLSLCVYAHILFTEKTLTRVIGVTCTFWMSLHAVVLYWIGHAFFKVGMGWLSPLAYLGMPLVMGLWTGSGCVLAWLFCHHLQLTSRVAQAAALGLFLSATYLLQGVGTLAFPWAWPAYTLPLHLLQGSAYIGAEGITWALIFISLSMYAWHRTWGCVAALVGVGAIIQGVQRMPNALLVPLSPFTLRLVQPCVAQEDKWDRTKILGHLYKQVMLSQTPSPLPIQAVIWPESAVPLSLSRYPDVQRTIAHASPQGGHLITGTIRFQNHVPHNSLIALDGHGRIRAAYDKIHLVPFGEYIPFKRYLPFVQKITHGSRDFGRGTSSGMISFTSSSHDGSVSQAHNEASAFSPSSSAALPPFRALICYEGVFSRDINTVEKNIEGNTFGSCDQGAYCMKKRPLWLLNVTNDGWYGQSSGPYQHLFITQVRAIEQGLPLVRCANNGISVITDPFGRVRHMLPLDVEGILDGKLPCPLPQTFYGKHGTFILPLLLILNMCVLLVMYKYARRRSHAKTTP